MVIYLSEPIWQTKHGFHVPPMYDDSRLQHAQHEKKPGTPGTGNAPHMYDTYFRIYAA